MWRVCSLIAVLMHCTVLVHVSDNMREESKRESPAESVRNLPELTQLCGRGLENTLAGGKRDYGLDDNDKWDNLDKIFRGSEVVPAEVPWHVNILVNGLHRCGGVIITEYWVLTSAFCVYGEYVNYGEITLVAGDHSMSEEDKGQQTFHVYKIYTHAEYNKTTGDFNIALVLIWTKNRRGIQFSEHVQPVCLPDDEEDLRSADSLTVSGWGDFCDLPTTYKTGFHKSLVEFDSDWKTDVAFPIESSLVIADEAM